MLRAVGGNERAALENFVDGGRLAETMQGIGELEGHHLGAPITMNRHGLAQGERPADQRPGSLAVAPPRPKLCVGEGLCDGGWDEMGLRALALGLPRLASREKADPAGTGGAVLHPAATAAQAGHGVSGPRRLEVSELMGPRSAANPGDLRRSLAGVAVEPQGHGKVHEKFYARRTERLHRGPQGPASQPEVGTSAAARLPQLAGPSETQSLQEPAHGALQRPQRPHCRIELEEGLPPLPQPSGQPLPVQLIRSPRAPTLNARFCGPCCNLFGGLPQCRQVGAHSRAPGPEEALCDRDCPPEHRGILVRPRIAPEFHPFHRISLPQQAQAAVVIHGDHEGFLTRLSGRACEG
mmetsp:Transcript_56/g.219  ORF Transcript_56/g.219 Transcript_56/m.219 type:complete len:352 (+) Transcript_56:1827-2882(+)